MILYSSVCSNARKFITIYFNLKDPQNYYNVHDNKNMFCNTIYTSKLSITHDPRKVFLSLSYWSRSIDSQVFIFKNDFF